MSTNTRDGQGPGNGEPEEGKEPGQVQPDPVQPTHDAETSQDPADAQPKAASSPAPAPAPPEPQPSGRAPTLRKAVLIDGQSPIDGPPPIRRAPPVRRTPLIEIPSLGMTPLEVPASRAAPEPAHPSPPTLVPAEQPPARPPVLPPAQQTPAEDAPRPTARPPQEGPPSVLATLSPQGRPPPEQKPSERPPGAPVPAQVRIPLEGHAPVPIPAEVRVLPSLPGEVETRPVEVPVSITPPPQPQPPVEVAIPIDARPTGESLSPFASRRPPEPAAPPPPTPPPAEARALPPLSGQDAPDASASSAPEPSPLEPSALEAPAPASLPVPVEPPAPAQVRIPLEGHAPVPIPAEVRVLPSLPGEVDREVEPSPAEQSASPPELSPPELSSPEPSPPEPSPTEPPPVPPPPRSIGSSSRPPALLEAFDLLDAPTAEEPLPAPPVLTEPPVPTEAPVAAEPPALPEPVPAEAQEPAETPIPVEPPVRPEPLASVEGPAVEAPAAQPLAADAPGEPLSAPQPAGPPPLAVPVPSALQPPVDPAPVETAPEPPVPSETPPSFEALSPAMERQAPLEVSAPRVDSNAPTAEVVRIAEDATVEAPADPTPIAEPEAEDEPPVDAPRRTGRGRWVRRLIAAGMVLAVMLSVTAGLLWLILHTKIRVWFWDQIAERPLSDGAMAELASCQSVGYWTLLQVTHADLEVTCGEAWLVTEMAAKIKSGDRAHWFELQVSNPASPPGRKVRAAVALALAGWTPPAEPAWLLETLPPHRQAEWLRAAVERDEVAVHLGPALRTLGIAARVRQDLAPGAASLSALEWLAWVDDPVAEEAATTTATQVAGVFPELVEQVRGRAKAGRPVGGAAARWRSLVAQHPECNPTGAGEPGAPDQGEPAPSRCAPLFTAILEQTLTDQALEDGTPLPPEPEEHPELAQILTALGAPSQERRAVAYGWSALVDWVKAAPEPAARLRSFARRPTGPVKSLARIPWDGVAPPFLSAVVVSELGEAVGVPVEVRVGETGEVWLNIGGVQVARSCSPTSGTAPSTDPWPAEAVLAGALTERAAAETDPTRALRLATAAERIDPLIGGPLSVRLASGAAPELEVGRRIGASLLRPVSPPVGADTARRKVGEKGPIVCQ